MVVEPEEIRMQKSAPFLLKVSEFQERRDGNREYRIQLALNGCVEHLRLLFLEAKAPLLMSTFTEESR